LFGAIRCAIAPYIFTFDSAPRLIRFRRVYGERHALLRLGDALLERFEKKWRELAGTSVDGGDRKEISCA
jgi:hypothetical protein